MSDQIAVTGNLTSPPQRHDLAGGVTMATFGLATTERRQQNGVWTDVHTNFYSVSAFRGLAEHALQSLVKGQRVIVAGKLQLKPWQTGDRSGISADLEATSLGPDLKFGVASFAKDAANASAAPETPDGWAVPGTSGGIEHGTGFGAGQDAGQHGGQDTGQDTGQHTGQPAGVDTGPGTRPGIEPHTGQAGTPATDPGARTGDEQAAGGEAGTARQAHEAAAPLVGAGHWGADPTPF